MLETATRGLAGWYTVHQCSMCGRSPENRRRVEENTEIRTIREKVKKAVVGDYGNVEAHEIASSPVVIDETPPVETKEEKKDMPSGAEKDLREIRKENLQRIVEYLGGIPKLNALYPAINKTSVANILAGRNGMGDKNARGYEEILNFPEGWFDKWNMFLPSHFLNEHKSPELDTKATKEMMEEKGPSIDKTRPEPRISSPTSDKNIASLPTSISGPMPVKDSDFYCEIPLATLEAFTDLARTLAPLGWDKLTICRRR